MGDTTTRTFQLVKRYTPPWDAITGSVVKPPTANDRYYKCVAAGISALDFTVDPKSGIVTFRTAV